MKVKLESATPVGVCMKGHMRKAVIRLWCHACAGRVGEIRESCRVSARLMVTMHESVSERA